MGHERAKFEVDAKELSFSGEIGFRCFGLWTSRGDRRLAVEGRDHHLPVADCCRSKSAGAFAVSVPDHLDRRGVCRPLVEYKFHAVSLGMAEPPDQLANLRAARARAFAASTSRFLGGALVSSEASSLLETAAISSTAA